LHGVYPPIPTLFNEDGSLAVDKLTNNLTKLLSETDSHAEFKGLVVLGSNGGKIYPTHVFDEYRVSNPFSPRKENRPSNRTKGSQQSQIQVNQNSIIQFIFSKRHLIAGTGSNSTSDTIEMTNTAADMGYDAALVRYLKLNFLMPRSSPLIILSRN
jgi:dihydrodipicolinate synthase/N-acetylneuraminate lyase